MHYSMEQFANLIFSRYTDTLAVFLELERYRNLQNGRLKQTTQTI